jgi:hypothetical protein
MDRGVRRPGRGRALAAAALSLVLAGCAAVTPQKIPVDRLEYGQVVAESWKRQTLLNVVRMRYGDAPMFLDVSSIINSYSMGGKASARLELPSRIDPNVFEIGGEGTWSNTPTVTYQPLMGARFTNSMLQPIPPTALLRLVQSGWGAELVFRTVLRSVNGLRNASSGVEGDPRFRELIDTMERIQAAGGFDMRLLPRKDGTAVVMVLPDEADAALHAERRRLVELLGLQKDATELEIVYGRSSRGASELAMITRSMLEIMLELGFCVELPATHATDGSTLPGRGVPGGATGDRLVRIRSGAEAPADAYAAVNYRGHWFWIDGTDIASKRTFTFMLILFSLAETGQAASMPLVTVPSR